MFPYTHHGHYSHGILGLLLISLKCGGGGVE